MQPTVVHLWNVTFERQIGQGWLASVGYVGSKTNNIWESTPLNLAPFVTLNGQAPSAANINARRPLTQLDPVNGPKYGILDLYVTDGTQRYNGMLLSIRSTPGRYGSTFAANYTLSHCFGSPDGSGGGTPNPATGYNKPEDPHYDDGNCTSDRLHNFSMTAGIQSPAAWGKLGSDWRLVGSFRALTGPWLALTTGTDIALNGQGGTQRPNQILDDPYGDQSVNPATQAIKWLNVAAFAQPGAGTLGAAAARNVVRGPGTKSIDLALSRLFRMGKTQGIEVRAEAFNALNWFELGQPGVSLLTPAAFGQITSTSNAVPPRVMQFAVKYQF
jgi:hypothetical protein